MRHALLLLGLLVGFATSHALTFQFVSKSSRKIIVETTYDAVVNTSLNQIYVVGKAGDDILIERMDRFGNVFAQTVYDGPGLGNEIVLDATIDNFNQPVVLYQVGGETRLAKFEASLPNIYDIPVGSNDLPVQLHKGLAGTVIAVGEDSNGDMLAKKFATNGSVVWRTVVIENGSTDFFDGAVGPGEEVALAGKNVDRGVIARLRGSDGARTATQLSLGDANANNRFETIAYAPDTASLFGAGLIDGGTGLTRTAIRITTTNNGVLQNTMTGAIGSNAQIAASLGATPRVVVVADTGNGMMVSRLNISTLVPTNTVETHPLNPKIFMPSNGGGFVVYGDSGVQLAIPNAFARFDNAAVRTYSIASSTPDDQFVDADNFLNLGTVAVGSSRDANDQKVGLLAAGNDFGQLIKFQEQRVHHPSRSLIDSAVDTVGAHYTLTRLNGAIEAPFVVKHSASGQQIWGAQLSFAGLPFLRPIAMAIGPNGHPVIVCTGTPDVDPDSGNWVLFQLNNSNGSVRWSKILSIGNPATGAPADIDVHSDNSIGVVGRVNFFGTDSNFAAARLTTAGVVQWTRLFQTLGPDRLEACRFRPTGELATVGFVGGSFPGRLQILTFSVDGGFIHQSVIEEISTVSGIQMDMETSGNILVSYKVDKIPDLDPDPTVVRRINPTTGATLMQSSRDGAPASRAAGRVSPDGNVWVVHTALGGLIETYRVNGTTGVQSQVLALPVTVVGFGDIAVRSDSSAIVAGLENSGAGVTAIVRRLPTGGQAALRRIAGLADKVRNGPGGVVWVAGDVRSRGRGTEQFAAKYAVP